MGNDRAIFVKSGFFTRERIDFVKSRIAAEIIHQPDGETKLRIRLVKGFGSNLSSIGQILKKAASLAKIVDLSEQLD
ncbi:MAG: PH domain-containing protein [Oscillatoriales cyanobacterium RU_3_3]|nr:PH domain-containing protein [Microcoleus sp. SU_5_6]NJL68332.1 PH domain-containing protein [Microcoleus sp. SM1_3_4]NJM60706.1 PH domain-containing protein [Oscillatoriales cyanobacterium RU_3_3]NJR25469.1 PH domain-containing protein [Richelia sp. CSU_2_1]